MPFPKGNKANPGGMTKDQREARDALRQFCSVDLMDIGKAAYRSLLETGNPVIVKDWMDRVAGKVKEVADGIEGEEPISAGEALAILRWVREERAKKGEGQ